MEIWADCTYFIVSEKMFSCNKFSYRQVKDLTMFCGGTRWFPFLQRGSIEKARVQVGILKGSVPHREVAASQTVGFYSAPGDEERPKRKGETLRAEGKRL